MPAFHWARTADWPLAKGLARCAFALLRREDRMAEGAEVLVALREAAETQGDWDASDECSSELSWIRGLPYPARARTPTAGSRLGFGFSA
jgi:hypothetical protein